MTLQHKSFPVSCVKALDEAQGIAEMVVSVFNNVDAAKDRVRPGFFKASLARKLPKGAWMHDWAQPVAKTLEATELQPGDTRLPEQIREYGGLYVKGQFNLGTQRGREAFSDLAFGTVDEFSFGYTVEKSAFDPKTGITDLLEGTIYEWSPVLVGCNPATALVGVKATPDAEHPTPDTEAPEASDASEAADPEAEPTDTKISDTLPAGASFEDQLSAALAAVEAVSVRASEIAALRAKSGRSISSERRSQIAALKAALDLLLLEPEPPTSAVVDVSHLIALRLKHRERTARLLAG